MSDYHTFILVPHPDDAVVRLSWYLRMACQRGDVIDVLQATDGAATAVRHRLGLTEAETTLVRYTEQRAAMDFLTQATAAIHRFDLPDGQAAWQDIYAMAKLAMGTPQTGKELYVATWHHDSPESHPADQHPDHAACVLAARALAQDGHVVRFARHPRSEYTRGTSYYSTEPLDQRLVIGAVASYTPIGQESSPNVNQDLLLSTRNRITH